MMFNLALIILLSFALALVIVGVALIFSERIVKWLIKDWWR